jgi:uncharacterized protein involved in exopolysaccharide biosynthesis
LDAIPWRGALSLLGRAVRRHWFVALTIALLFTGVAVAAAILLPRSFQGETRILVRKGTSVMSAVTDPRRAIVPGFDQPGQAAVELALSRSALEYIVREADLVTHFYAHRPLALQWVDRARVAVFGPLAPADQEDAVIGLLQARLQVSYGEEVVRMRLRWWTADAVELILTHAVAAYLAERRRFDIESLEETQRILTTAVQSMRAEMTQQVGVFHRARSQATGQRNTVADRRPPTSVELGQLRDRVTERRKYREELEEQRRERLALLEIQLAQQVETLGPSHPDRIATERAIAGLGTNDDAIRRARLEESRITDEFLAAGGSLDIFGEGIEDDEPIDLAAIRPDDDPAVIAARGELRIRVDGYQDLTMRLENARLELETARAALPFRYVVTQPPTRPRRPMSPNVLIIVLGGIVTGVGAGVLLAVSLRIRDEARAAGRGIVAHLARLDEPVVFA